MKKYIVGISLLANIISMQAQDNESTCFPYNAGGFGHFFTGPAYFHTGKLGDYLEKPDVLNANLPVRPGNMSGGEGVSMLGRFLIGGGGFGETTDRITTDSARANFSFGAGYFKFGYILKYKNGNFCYGYGGIGWGGVNVHIENLSDENEIRFNHRAPIQPGHKADYTLPCTFYDLGISYKKMFMSSDGKEGQGGFMLGVDLGCSLALSMNDWQGKNEEVVTGPPAQAGMLNPYVRVTIGGGGFRLCSK